MPLHAFSSVLFLLFLITLHSRSQTPALYHLHRTHIPWNNWHGTHQVLSGRWPTEQPEATVKVSWQVLLPAHHSSPDFTKGVSMKGRPRFEDPPLLPWAFKPLQFQSNTKTLKTERQTKWNLLSEVPDTKRILNYIRNISWVVTVFVKNNKYILYWWGVSSLTTIVITLCLL